MDDQPPQGISPERWELGKTLLEAPVQWDPAHIVPSKQIDLALLSLRDCGYLHGVILPDDPTLCVFRLADRRTADALVDRFRAGVPAIKCIRLFPYLWPMRLGFVFSLMVTMPQVPWHAKVAAAVDPSMRPKVERGLFRCVFVHERRAVVTATVDFRSGPRFAEAYESNILTNFASRSEVYLDCPEAVILNFVEFMNRTKTEQRHGYQPRPLTKRDRLSLGWVRRFENSAWMYSLCVRDLRASGVKPPDELRHTLGWLGCVGDLADGSLDPSAFFIAAVSELERDPVDCCKAITHAINSFASFATNEFKDYADLLIWLRGMLFISSQVTRLGRCFGWISATRSLERLELDANSLADKVDISTLWERIGAGPSIGLGEFIVGNDVPADLGPKSKLWDLFPRAESAEEAESATEAMLGEALANKQWTIPNGAVVLLPVGPFSHIEVYERLEVVNFVLRTVDNEYTFLSIWPANGQWEWPPFMSFLPSGEDYYRLSAGIRLLLASIIRDFWVVEERERTFATVRRPLGRSATWKDAAASTRVVYLPRIRYTGTADIRQCETELNYAERRPHYVRAHLRRAETSSDEQRMLAQMYGFDLPTGYTFVRPHHRGHHQCDVVYRSRSALQSLYTTEVIAPADEVRPRWFAFERDVKRLMERLGFEVQHTSASRSGDRGVDLYATKGSGLDVADWIIQCKCFNPRRSVGVAVVRDLIGALAAYPDGTQAMIATTSRFTTEAVELAGAHNIRLIDGREFLSLGGQLRTE